MHNVALRQRALKRGLTLSEYALLRLDDNTIVAAATEADIYRALDLDYIAPSCARTAASSSRRHQLPAPPHHPRDIRGDLHMHTDATSSDA